MKTFKIKNKRVKRCHIRIDIQGKEFAEIKEQLRKAVVPFVKNVKDIVGYGKFDFIQEYITMCLHDFYAEYVRQNSFRVLVVSKKDAPYANKLQKKKGSFDMIFDIVFNFGAESWANAFVDAFIVWFMKKLFDLLNNNDNNGTPPSSTIINSGKYFINNGTINIEYMNPMEEVANLIEVE